MSILLDAGDDEVNLLLVEEFEAPRFSCELREVDNDKDRGNGDDTSQYTLREKVSDGLKI